MHYFVHPKRGCREIFDFTENFCYNSHSNGKVLADKNFLSSERMKKMEQLKKAAMPVAGIALILYAFISLLRGVSGFLPILFEIGIVVLGITSLIEKTEPVRIGASALLAVVSLFGLFDALLDFLRMLLRGYFSFGGFVLSVIQILGAVLELIAFLALVVLLYMFWKRMQNVLTKFWYAPAALSLVSGIFGVIFSVFLCFIYSIRISFSFITNNFLQIILAVVLAVGIAALSFGSQKE